MGLVIGACSAFGGKAAEEPKYKIVLADGNIEVRAYPARRRSPVTGASRGKCRGLCYCIAFAEVVRIYRLRAAPTVAASVQTMNSPPTSRLACGPEGLHPARMRHALEVLTHGGIDGYMIVLRSPSPISRGCPCPTPAARPRSGR